MAWAGSAMFTSYVADCINQLPEMRQSWAFAGSQFMVALFDSLVTPDRNTDPATARYLAGQWTGPRECAGGGWPAGGAGSGGSVAADGDGSLMIVPSAAGLSRAGATLTDVCGDLIWYRDPGPPIAAEGPAVAFHDYGGSTSVVAGGVTITWPPAAAGGMFRINVG